MKERFISNGRWYYTLTVATAGLFAFAPFLHAAAKLSDERQRRRALVYGGLAIVLLVLVGITPTDELDDPVGAMGGFLSTLTGILAVAIIATACYQLKPLREAVYPPHLRRSAAQPQPEGAWPPPPPPASSGAWPAPQNDQQAVDAVMRSRERRRDARGLADRDPAMAIELGIGQPHHVGDYNDGGLVDFNRANEATLVEVLGLSPDVAAETVRTRESWGSGYSSIEEVLAHVTVNSYEAEVIRDRGITLPG